MKLYSEEQVRQMLSIYMANVLLNVDGKMPTVDEILSYKTPIELPSDEEIREDGADTWVFKTNSMKWSNNNCEAGDNFGSFIAGAKWMKEQILNQNK
jgi:hypothetical protein